MEAIQENVCRAANRISTAVGFLEGSANAETIHEMFLHGFKALETILFELSQNGFRQTIHRVLSAARRPSAINPDQFTRHQCDLLHQVNLHERTIKSIGNDLVGWRPNMVTADQIDERLGSLEYVAACCAEQFANDCSRAELAEVNQYVTALHAIANGLAIMVVNTEEPNAEYSHLAIKYGASLIEKGLSKFGSLATSQIATRASTFEQPR